MPEIVYVENILVDRREMQEIFAFSGYEWRSKNSSE